MNWQEVINALVDAGMTQDAIAKEANCSQGFISDLKNGKRDDCLYNTGNALVGLLEKVKTEQPKAA